MNRRAFVHAAAALAAGGPAFAAQARLRAGAAREEITPDLARPVWLAGFNHGRSNRRAEGVHDPLYARALALEAFGKPFVVVGLDLIGFFRPQVEGVRRRLRAVPPERAVFCATHTHSGPDTLGLWGPDERTPGVDPVYLQRLEDRVVAAVEAAVRSLRPARLIAGHHDIPPGIAHNLREPLLDRAVTALRFVDQDERTIATLVHFGCHPEVMMEANRLVSADYCGATLARVEAEFGGIGVFVNGALGGMVTPQVRERSWGEVERVGRAVGETAIAALRGRPPVAVDRFRYARTEVTLPLANERFRQLAAAGLLRSVRFDGEVPTEVVHLAIGPVRIVTIPGEILPRPALELKRRIGGEFPLVFSLANDELGYILAPADFDRDLFRYERSMSVGPETWLRLREAAVRLLEN